ncbi:MAG TPA: Gfo/Idh/MocA family oxidoreductase, partial [Planctomycetota bacterium]|nr:Gfo/Idh/MocA family oxidoreductase [Planctomycetota bacterium]
MSKKRYAQVGLGGRSRMYTRAIVERYAEVAQLVGLCDVNRKRMDLVNRTFFDGDPVPAYPADDFDRMVAETRPDVVIVTSMDSAHDRYICRAMELGCDVVTEKPMTTDDAKCRRILKTIARTGRKLQVTFNYRYSPPRTQLKEMLSSGVIGEVLSVDFGWYLDTSHGADYFRRWHRRRENSGSLLVHKATHHFDIVNWLIDDVPEEVFAHGSRRYYVPATAERFGLAGRTERCLTCPCTATCPFHLDLRAHEHMKALYLDCESEDGYFRDRCVFSPEIDIWDNMSLAVRYRGGALMSYMLHAYSPYEGLRIAFNGTKGRLEHTCAESTYVSGDGTVPGELARKNVSTVLIPEFEKPRLVEVRLGTGGHGGGDDPLLADVFDPNAPPDPFRRKAGSRDGAYSILIGVAAARSI